MVSAAGAAVRRLVADVPDPEIPVITIDELGILRGVEVVGGRVVITITPTYSGCPAIDAIRGDIAARLRQAGFDEVEVRTVLSPPWTTDWISDSGLRKLHDFGIAPPSQPAAPKLVQLSVCCPRCSSFDVREVSRFGSTACKALYACNACREPFDHFKAI
jgi:ring-1,2-phenylacetyl-CoA epoxidase subunit PaaD